MPVSLFTTISALGAVAPANLTGAAVLPLDDANGATKKVSIDQLRALFGGDLFDVTDALYGAVGDGVTDDTQAIKAAVAAATAAIVAGAPRATVYFPAGVFIGAVRTGVQGNLTIRGESPSATTIKQRPTVQRIVADASMALGSAVVTSAAAAFNAGDVGRAVRVVGAGIENDLVAEVLSVAGNTATLDRVAGRAVAGVGAYIRCARNVIEINNGYDGNSTSAISGVAVYDLTIDGNKANVPAPVVGTDDLVNHGILATHALAGAYANLRCVDCHNSGAAWVIVCDDNTLHSVVAERCGNSTSGIPGLDVNSSCDLRGSDLAARNCYVGFRLLDNCHRNHIDVGVYKATTFGVLLNNQLTNSSCGNFLRATVEEAGLYGCAVEANCFDNQLELVLRHSGSSGVYPAGGLAQNGPASAYTVQATGLLVGSSSYTDAQKPQRNRIVANVAWCGGIGAVVQANDNTLDLICTGNSAGGALASYALELNGSRNTIRFQGFDPNTSQRGIIVRAAGGEVGTAATGNRLTIVVPNPTSPLDAGAGATANAVVFAESVQASTVANVTVTTATHLRVANAATAVIATLPAVTGFIGRRLTIKKTDTGAGTITVTAAGGETIDGSATSVIAGGSRGAMRLVATGAGWDQV
jgi:hypothetical protein